MPTDVLQRRRAGSSGTQTVGAALGRAAVALNSAMDLPDVLGVFTHEVVAHTGARRASVLLCHPNDPGSPVAWLEPAASTARENDPLLWQAFHAAERVDLTDDQQALFDRAGAVPVADGAASRLIPPGWADRFQVESIVLVPLFAEGRRCGLLAADYPRQRSFRSDELQLLEAFAELGGLAVHKARQHEQDRRRARLRGVVSDAIAVLVQPLDRIGIVAVLISAMRDLLDAEVVGAGLLARDGSIRPHGITDGWRLPAPVRLDDVPSRIVDPVARIWAQGATLACEFPADRWLRDLLGDGQALIRRFVLLPLLNAGNPIGAVLAGLRRGTPLDDDARGAAQALASLGGLALQRGAAAARLARHVRAGTADRGLHLAEVGPTTARDLPSALDRLAEALEQAGAAVDVTSSRRHVRLPLPVEGLLYEVAWQTLTVAGPARADAGPSVAGSARVCLRVASRRARLTVTLASGHQAADVLGPLQAGFASEGGGLDVRVETTGEQVVEAWLPRQLDRASPSGRHTPSEHAPYRLTDRERQVLELLVRRRTNPEIARELNLSVHTVKTHVSAILAKLGVESRAAAAQRAVDEALVEAAPKVAGMWARP